VLNVNVLRRSHTYRTFEVGVITCWFYRSVSKMFGHLCDFDLVLGIDITKDDDWVLPVFMLVLFHILLHQLMILFIYFLWWPNGRQIVLPLVLSRLTFIVKNTLVC
jgi:hypothetical protein